MLKYQFGIKINFFKRLVHPSKHFRIFFSSCPKADFVFLRIHGTFDKFTEKVIYPMLFFITGLLEEFRKFPRIIFFRGWNPIFPRVLYKFPCVKAIFSKNFHEYCRNKTKNSRNLAKNFKETFFKLIPWIFRFRQVSSRNFSQETKPKFFFWTK